MELKVMNKAGKEVGKVELNDELFNIEYNEALIHQIVVAQLANRRQGTKCTLTRAEVRGGGIKPYRQKGTGRARQGSIRAPQFIKGGVVFAPKPRDFSKKTNKFARRLALLSALSEKIRQNEVTVIDNLELKEVKTKEVAAILKALNLNKTTLIVTAEKDELVLRASGNLEKVEVTTADLINVYEVVKNNDCLFTKAAIEKIEEANA
ncbi:MAG: 50S ribosomal protein L4 [Eubacteriales bacterium]|nr:50S ribosomal protein L4 [Christensenellaceae bacterium]MDD7092591.1 50S ribosomal protein L4 [Christensenellaceae bacterium]MDY3241817.1 50S ribosomal protein L4 [Eubacteriales bacterium]MDY4709760.1 50S ribosomal protein L4 [Eubacteriales bacterium]